MLAKRLHREAMQACDKWASLSFGALGIDAESAAVVGCIGCMLACLSIDQPVTSTVVINTDGRGGPLLINPLFMDAPATAELGAPAAQSASKRAYRVALPAAVQDPQDLLLLCCRDGDAVMTNGALLKELSPQVLREAVRP